MSDNRTVESEEEGPRRRGFTITNGMLATLISAWFVFGQVESMIKASANRDSERAAHGVAIDRHTVQLNSLLEQGGTLDRIGDRIGKLENDLEALRGEVKASRDRSFEAETALQKNMTRLEADSKNLQAVDLTPVLEALADLRKGQESKP